MRPFWWVDLCPPQVVACSGGGNQVLPAPQFACFLLRRRIPIVVRRERNSEDCLEVEAFGSVDRADLESVVRYAGVVVERCHRDASLAQYGRWRRPTVELFPRRCCRWLG